MKYCRECGKALLDGELCTCPGATAQRSAKNIDSDDLFGFENQTFKQEQQEQQAQFNQSQAQDVVQNYAQPKEGMGKCIATAIIYPVIVVLVAIVLFATGSSSIWGLLVAIACSAAGAFFVILSGFYLIIIPLPIVYLLKYGSVKHELSLGKKVVFGLLAVGLLVAGLFAAVYL